MDMARLKTSALLALLFSCALAGAQETALPAPPATDSGGAAGDPCFTDERCNSLSESAARLSKVGQFSAAVDTYRAAYELKPVPWLLLNIGRVQQKMGQSQEAIATYDRFLKDSAAGKDPELQEKARKYQAQAQADVDRLRAPAPGTDLAGSTEKAPEARRPVYKKWWFWTALAGGVVAAAAVGLGVGLSGQNQSQPPGPPMVPAGVTIYKPTF